MKVLSRYFALFTFIVFFTHFIEAPIAAAQNSPICIPNRILGPTNEPGNLARFEGDYIAYDIDEGGKFNGYVYQISTGVATKILNGTERATIADIEGDLIAFTSSDPQLPNYPENSDIYLYHVPTGEITRITATKDSDFGAVIQGDYIVFMPGFRRYALHRISTGEFKDITPTFAFGLSSTPAFQGDVAAWTFQRLPYDVEPYSSIGYHRISTGETKFIDAEGTTDGEAPEVYGDYIVWQLFDGVMGAIGGDIALFNVVTEELTLITDDDIYDGRPLIEGDYVIWERFDGNDNEIFQYQISTGITTQLTDTPADETAQDFRDDHIVVTDSTFALRLMNRGTGEMTTINDSLTMWLDLLLANSYVTDAGRLLYFPIGLQDIYLYDPANPDTCAPNLLRNGSFENGFNNWKGANRTQDTVACTNLSKGQIRSYHQKCGFRFVSGPGENSSISQAINLRQSGLKSGDQLTFGAWVWPVRALPKGRITALVTLKSGKTQRMGIPFPQTRSGGFTMLKKTITLQGAPVSLKYTINNRGEKREVRLDRAFVFVEPPPGAISLPSAQPAPDGLRGSN